MSSYTKQMILFISVYFVSQANFSYKKYQKSLVFVKLKFGFLGIIWSYIWIPMSLQFFLYARFVCQLYR